MPWQLTTPVSVGDLDPNGPYNQIKIVGFQYYPNRKMLTVFFEYGNTVNGEWIRGIAPTVAQTSVTLVDQDCVDFITANQSLYDSVASTLYSWLQSDNKIDDGSVV